MVVISSLYTLESYANFTNYICRSWTVVKNDSSRQIELAVMFVTFFSKRDLAYVRFKLY